MVRLNAVALFGQPFEWTLSTIVLVVMLVQVALAAVALIAFVFLMLRKRSAAKKRDIFVGYVAIAPKERNLLGIGLNLSAVKREFTAGETFTADGLVVTARFDSEPTSERVDSYTVEAPDMEYSGEKKVIVRYGNFEESYSVTVLPARLRETERRAIGMDLDLESVRTDFIVGDTFDCAGLIVTVRYNAEPFEERVTDFICEAPDLSEKGIKNVVVKYSEFEQTYPVFVAEGRIMTGISLNTDAVRREFQVGEAFDCSGLIVTAEYDDEPLRETVTDYETDAPDLTREGEAEVSVHYRGMTASYSVSVIAPPEPEREDAGSAAEETPVPATEEEPAPPAEEEPAPEEGAAPAAEEPVFVDEGKVLRYDRSFTARLIQADDDTKRRYAMLKNEILSYRDVKSRMSWRKETYKFGGGNVARLGFRGNILCLFLPLDFAEYVGSRYKVESAAGEKSNEEMPCLFRIKNDKRVRLAYDLIARVMAERGLERTNRPAQNYEMPYETTESLIEKGLIRSAIKAKVDDSMFPQKN